VVRLFVTFAPPDLPERRQRVRLNFYCHSDLHPYLSLPPSRGKRPEARSRTFLILCDLCALWLIFFGESMPAHPLIPTAGSEDFAEPFAAQLRIDLAVHDHRSGAVVEPGSEVLQVCDVADGHSLRAHG